MKLNPNDALAILGYLKDEGIVTEDQIEKAITKNPGEDLKAAVLYCHMIMCVEVGNGGCRCGYEKEEMETNTWELEHHIRWLVKTEGVINTLNTNAHDLLQEINDFNIMFQALQIASPTVQFLFQMYWRQVIKNKTADEQ